jgi:hypothetical protein
MESLEHWSNMTKIFVDRCEKLDSLQGMRERSREKKLDYTRLGRDLNSRKDNLAI